MDPIDMHHHQQAEPLFQSMPPLTDLRFDLTASTMDVVGIDDMSINLPLGLNFEDSLETESSGVVPHDYIDGLISGLDDCTAFPEYTDIR